MEEGKELVGKVIHYYGKIGVAVVELEKDIKVGDEIAIEGPSTSFTQKVSAMQVEHEPLQEAKAGQAIGLKVEQPVHAKDNVYVSKG